MNVYPSKIKNRMLNARERAVPDIEYLAKWQPGGWDELQVVSIKHILKEWFINEAILTAQDLPEVDFERLSKLITLNYLVVSVFILL